MASSESKSIHGGDLTAAAQRYGIHEGAWLDLSTGINPHAFPLPAIDNAVWRRLPLPSEETALLRTARDAYGLTPSTGICAAPGTQALIQWLPLLVNGRPEVTILGPTYSEHERRWRAANASVREVKRLADAGSNIIVVVNPNNPDGRVTSPEALLQRAATLPTNGFMVVDESFADVMPQVSILPHLSEERVIVLRSFGKTYGLAGLRLGFAAGSADLIGALRDHMGAWAVPGPALAIGQKALANTEWLKHMRQDLAEESARLDDHLIRAGLAMIGGTPLFRLASHASAIQVHESLARDGIWTRVFPYNPQWIRFGLPGNEKAWARLEHALSELKVDH